MTRWTDAQFPTQKPRWLRPYLPFMLSAGLIFGCALSGCLQDSDISADILTDTDATPGAGIEANMNINGGDTSSGGTTEGGDPAADAGEHVHQEMPPGFGHTPSPATETAPTGSPEAAPASSPEAHVHVEMPPGAGKENQMPPEGKPEPVPPPAGGAAATAPAGEPVPVAGEPDKVRPAVETPFERDYKGKKMITVSGTVVYDGKSDADVDIDCFVPAPSSPAGRKLVNKVKLSAPGPYTMQVPAGFGPLIVTAFIDLKQDGPDSKDPQGAYSSNPIDIKDKDVSKIDITLKSVASSSK